MSAIRYLMRSCQKVSPSTTHVMRRSAPQIGHGEALASTEERSDSSTASEAATLKCRKRATSIGFDRQVIVSHIIFAGYFM